MIKLSSKTYNIEQISKGEFWKKLDEITLGQYINPEISYTTQFLGNFDNVFAGRKSENKFSIYLYRPITSGFRTEILAKGKITEISTGLKIDVRYDIPFWSIFALILLGSMTLLNIWVFYNEIVSMVITSIITIIYILIVRSNHKDIKMEIEKQFLKFGAIK